MNLPTWSTEQAPGIQNCTQRPCLKNNNKNKQIFFSQKKKQAKDKNTKTKKKAQEKTWNLFCVGQLLLSVHGACLGVWLMCLPRDTAWEKTHFPFPSKHQLK